MNWSLIGWVAGILLTFAGIKFVFRLIHTLFSKDTMDAAIGAIENGCCNASDRFTDFVKRKVDKKKAEKNERPMIYIR